MIHFMENFKLCNISNHQLFKSLHAAHKFSSLISDQIITRIFLANIEFCGK
ncbi:hypothetical protein PGB90_004933 [Kerria lacca]